MHKRGSRKRHISVREIVIAACTGIGASLLCLANGAALIAKGLAHLITPDNISEVLHYDGKVAAGFGAFMGCVHFGLMFFKDTTKPKT